MPRLVWAIDVALVCFFVWVMYIIIKRIIKRINEIGD